MFTDPDLLDLDRLDKLRENELVLHLVKHNHPPNGAPPPPAGLEPDERMILNGSLNSGDQLSCLHLLSHPHSVHFAVSHGAGSPATIHLISLEPSGDKLSNYKL